MTFQTSGQSTDARTWAIIVWALYLAGMVVGITVLVGLVLAYVKRGELAGTPFESHMTYAIRTFWIGLIGFVVGLVLMIVLIGFVVLFAVAIWVIYRSVRGIVLAIDSRPIPNATGWL